MNSFIDEVVLAKSKKGWECNCNFTKQGWIILTTSTTVTTTILILVHIHQETNIKMFHNSLAEIIKDKGNLWLNILAPRASEKFHNIILCSKYEKKRTQMFPYRSCKNFLRYKINQKIKEVILAAWKKFKRCEIFNFVRLCRSL